MSNRPQAADVPRLRHIAWLVAAAVALAGCLEAGGSGASRSGAGQVDPRLTADPEEYLLEDFTLWNGEQTQLGSWIAHPDAHVARRVRITNTETGAQADAALILRDRGLRGPRVIVSTAAALALGLEQGHATPITIEALRYLTPEEIAAAKAAPAETPATASTDSEAPVAVEPEPEIEVSSLDDGESPDAIAEADLPAEGLAEADPLAADSTEPQPTGEPEVTEEAAPEALSAAVEAALDSLDQEAPPTAEPVESDTAFTPGPGTPVPQPRPERLAMTPEIAPAPDTAPAGSTVAEIADGRPYIQAGMFASASDADVLAGRLRDAGLSVEIRPLTLGADQLSRVLVGPFGTVAERDAAMKVVRDAGVTDAAPARG